jgi:hypothetical protein
MNRYPHEFEGLYGGAGAGEQQQLRGMLGSLCALTLQ